MKIFILPSEYSGDPEATAMLQAFYSRSFQGIEERLEKLGGDLTKVKKALNSYYIGYGHKSIGDCGQVTIFVEGISILAAKAIQDSPLYNGQESSTRYIDFLTSGCVYPEGSELGRQVADTQTQWLKAYGVAKEELVNLLTAELLASPEREQPLELTPTEVKAVNARAFDIARSLIPAGAKTNLSVHMSLRKISELFNSLISSDVWELAQLGVTVIQALKDRYPSSIEVDLSELYETIMRDVINNVAVLSPKEEFKCSIIANDLTPQARSILQRRKKYAPVNRQLGSQFLARITARIDYGSFRDIQRHRNGYMSPVQHNAELGFNSWYASYLDQLSEEFTIEFDKAKRQLQWLNAEIGVTPYLPYAIPLGYNVEFEVVWGLDQLIYVAELRSGETVHPTARKFAHGVASVLSNNNISHYCNLIEDTGISLRRGKQDITLKGTNK